MAQHQVSGEIDLGFTNKKLATEGSVASSGTNVSALAPYLSNNALDAEVIADYGYTQEQVDKMTQNDKIYAVRLANDPDTI